MIDFQRLDLNEKARYDTYLMSNTPRGCEYSFTNLFLWGRQKGAFISDRLALFSQYNRRSVYPFPVGPGDVKPALDAVIADARERGIPCYITSMTEADRETLEALYPGQFRFSSDRDTFDYVYAINDLADLKGRKYQKKRNHIHRFEEAYPDWKVLPLDENTRVAAFILAGRWFREREAADPHSDFHLEKKALQRAFAFQKELEFARHLRNKYPDLQWLNREDDMGLEGLRKAKLSYYPDHMTEKHWARLWEEEDDNC